MPRYIAIVALTIDGKIARLNGKDGSDWTSAEDKAFMREKLNDMDLIIVGRTTWQQYHKPLSKRKCLVFTSSVSDMKEENENLTYFNPSNASLENYIKEKGYQNICVLGGSQVYTYFLKNQLINDLYITIEPLIFGDGVPLFNQTVADQQWSLVEVRKLNDQGAVLLYYEFKM